MKITLMFILLISLVSCATKIKDSELEEYEYKKYDALKISLHEKIEAHSDYTTEQKFELNKIIDEALKDHKELKIEESKTVQLLMDSLLSENNDLKKINALKKKMANIYDRKTKLLYKTSSKIKKLLGIRPKNHILNREILPALL